MSLHSRLKRLEQEIPIRIPPEKCPGGPTHWDGYVEGQPIPPIPDDAARCEYCGEVHVLLFKEEIVSSVDEVHSATE